MLARVKDINIIQGNEKRKIEMTSTLEQMVV